MGHREAANYVCDRSDIKKGERERARMTPEEAIVWHRCPMLDRERRGTGRAHSLAFLDLLIRKGTGRGGCLGQAAVRSKWQRSGICADCGRNAGRASNGLFRRRSIFGLRCCGKLLASSGTTADPITFRTAHNKCC